MMLTFSSISDYLVVNISTVTFLLVLEPSIQELITSRRQSKRKAPSNNRFTPPLEGGSSPTPRADALRPLVGGDVGSLEVVNLIPLPLPKRSKD
ncbi:conserved hypothetical protein [Ricinus communis]|uniref:Uncharacterized protein n=1 Tax=Ricinus communis TaxID=3988 RepID=B9S3P0_RICCO|nr:conserved hypothetical protein [Ricinus communis]